MEDGGKLLKPQLRNLHLSRVKKNLVVVIMVCALAGASYKVTVTDAYDRAATKFYKNYDAEAALKKMNEAGYMESYNIGKD